MVEWDWRQDERQNICQQNKVKERLKRSLSILCRHAEPLSGVIEGVSAGLFLIVMMVGVTALLVTRHKARKV